MITTSELLELAVESACKDGNQVLAEKLRELSMSLEQESPPFEPPYTVRQSSEIFRLPSGKYRGRFLSELDDTELRNVWAGFNSSNPAIAATIRIEMDRRLAAQ